MSTSVPPAPQPGQAERATPVPVARVPDPEPPRRLFFGALAASFALLVYMFLPFGAVLLSSVVVVVVSWPVFVALSRRLGRVAAAVLTTLGLVVVVLGPLTLLVWLGVGEAVEAAQQLVAFVSSGGLEAWLADLQQRVDHLGWLRDQQVFELFGQALRESLVTVAQGTVGQLTGLLQLLVGGSIQVVVFLASVVTLFLEGPKLVAAVRGTGWMRDDVLDRLLERFAQFSHNVVVGMLATTAGQAAVAALGFALAGSPRVALLAVLTAICSQVPLIGSAVVWLPVAIGFVLKGHWGRALFVVLWSVVLTASVDNLLKPLLYRQGLGVSPVLVLLALLAGVTTFGPAGVLVGPLLVVVFLTLWTLYERDLHPAPRA